MSSDLLDAQVKQKPNVIVRKEENCYLLVNRKNGKLLVIDDIGFKTWTLLQKAPVKAVVKKLAREYAVDAATCEEEVTKLTKRLLAYGFVELIS